MHTLFAKPDTAEQPTAPFDLQRPEEQARIASLLRLLPPSARVLEIGTREGYISHCLAQHFPTVWTLDLERVDLPHPRITSMAGDVRGLEFPDRSFDVVLCSEVLEHIPPADLTQAGRELQRITAGTLLVGVPYKQDLRLARTTCAVCGGSNPPWGHYNHFDESDLDRLFPALNVQATEYIGQTRDATSALAAWLMERAGNPWGSYVQDDRCIHCGQALGRPRPRSLSDRLASGLAVRLDRLQARFTPERAKWIHRVYRRRD